MIAVIGASGFLGRNIQSEFKRHYEKDCKDVLMIYFKSSNNILEGFNKMSFYDFIKNQDIINKIDTLIVVSGNSDRNIDESNLYECINKDTKYILEMKDKIKCNVIFLSSAAVYDGKCGCVKETQSISPNSLYGICKYNSEMAIKYITKDIEDKKVIIYRLMYGYGNFERDSRLMPLINSCIKENKILKVNGYNNYLNPLSAEFISRIIIESSKNIDIFQKEEIINLTSLRKIKLMEVLELINMKRNLKYEIIGEEPIIKYYPSSDKLKYYLQKLNLPEEDIEKSIMNYFH